MLGRTLVYSTGMVLYQPGSLSSCQQFNRVLWFYVIDRVVKRKILMALLVFWISETLVVTSLVRQRRVGEKGVVNGCCRVTRKGVANRGLQSLRVEFPQTASRACIYRFYCWGKRNDTHAHLDKSIPIAQWTRHMENNRIHFKELLELRP